LCTNSLNIGSELHDLVESEAHDDEQVRLKIY